MRNRFSIMQGRLVPSETSSIQSFPRARWRDEFELAKAAGFGGIEWLYDLHGADVNPIATDEGIAELRSLSNKSGVRVESVCADWFKDNPFGRGSESEKAMRQSHFYWFVERCHRAGIKRIVLPLLDSARIDPGTERDVAAAILEVLPVCERNSVAINIESSLAPSDFRKFLDLIPSPLVSVNYDFGNSAAFGYDSSEEFAAYGNRIGSVHVKDRKLGTPSVPLGTGDADFPHLFRELAKIGYAGDLVFEAARGELGKEVENAIAQRLFVQNTMDGLGRPA
jgi:hexulose-6-phosphate isomerase